MDRALHQHAAREHAKAVQEHLASARATWPWQGYPEAYAALTDGRYGEAGRILAGGPRGAELLGQALERAQEQGRWAQVESIRHTLGLLSKGAP